MHASLPLITTFALAFGLALLFGYAAERLKSPALVGYLLAGIVASPYAGLVNADLWLASQLAEIGVMLLMFGVSNRTYLLDHATWSIMLPLGGVSALIVGMRAFFRGYGFILCCLWGSLGVLSSYIPVCILRFTNEHMPSTFIPVIIVITLIYILICHLTDYHNDSKSDSQLINSVMEDDIKSTLIEPLFYTFKQKSFKFKGSKFSMLDDVTNQVRSISGESVLHYLIWSLMIGVMLLEMVLFSPRLLDWNLPTKEKIQNVTPQKVIDKLKEKNINNNNDSETVTDTESDTEKDI